MYSQLECAVCLPVHLLCAVCGMLCHYAPGGKLHLAKSQPYVPLSTSHSHTDSVGNNCVLCVAPLGVGSPHMGFPCGVNNKKDC